MTGHYDNWHLGADDNASAVAVLLERREFRAAETCRAQSASSRSIAKKKDSSAAIGMHARMSGKNRRHPQHGLRGFCKSRAE